MGVRRLNGDELDNTLRDLFGITSRPSLSLPPDGAGPTFDNEASALAVTSPELMESYLEVFEAVADEALATSREKLVSCDEQHAGDDACARSTVSTLGERVFRRPLTADELEEVMTLWKEEATFDDGLRLAIRGMLSSPSFLYRTVSHPAPDDATQVHTLDDFELATRLSYFVWGTAPDEVLLEHARNGGLKDVTTLRAEVQRMLGDPRSSWLVDSLATQWLRLERVSGHAADPVQFPEFTPQLRADMLQETRALLDEIIRDDLSLLTLLTAEHTFVNERLANLYGLSGVTGEELWRVSLTGTGRRGLMTHAGILAMNSGSERTSIARRGQWVLTYLMCLPPPPRPAVVPTETVPEDFKGTSRQLAEAHRSRQECASCHSMMDPIGFGLEEFDAIGRARTNEEGVPIDSTGELPDGTTFGGALELSRLLEHRQLFQACAAQHFLSFAIGREPTAEDRCAARKIAERYVTADTPFSEFIVGIVTSEPFLNQRGGGSTP